MIKKVQYRIDELFIFLFLSITFLFYPLITMILALVLFLIYKASINFKFYLSIIMAIGLGIIGFLYNPNFREVGDIVRYYQQFYSFENFDINNANHLFNSFFYLIISFVKNFNFNAQYIIFILITLLYFGGFYSIYLIIKKERLDIKYFKIGIFIFLILYNPALMIKTCKNSLAFLLAGVGVINLYYNRRFLGYIFFLMGITMHFSTIIIAIVYLLTPSKKISLFTLVKQLLTAIIIIAFLGLFCIIVFGNNFINLIDYYTTAKYNSYILNNNFSVFSIDKFWIYIQALNKISIVIILLCSIEKENIKLKYYNFCVLLIMLSIVMIFNNTFFMRLTYSGICFYFILIFKYIKQKNSKYKKIVIVMLIFNLFTLDIPKALVDEATIGDSILESITYNWERISSYQIDLPY